MKVIALDKLPDITCNSIEQTRYQETKPTHSLPTSSSRFWKNADQTCLSLNKLARKYAFLD
jgi:hypothetical protein